MNKKALMKVSRMMTALLLAVAMFVSVMPAVPAAAAVEEVTPSNQAAYIKQLDDSLAADYTEYLDDSVAFRLTDDDASKEQISVIITVDVISLMDAYEESDKTVSFAEYVQYSQEAEAIRQQIAGEQARILSALDDQGVAYELGEEYDTLVSGFEILIQASDYDITCKSLGSGDKAVIGEVYQACETELVENPVSVYDTGIFKSGDSGYDGSGMVVAVLDTGLDSNHTAFSPENFTSQELGMTYQDVAAVIGKTTANKQAGGLSVDDVYINEKVPFGYDYADNDPDAYSTHNNHGTHVSGVIVGNDDVITGVAPNAQLVAMKIFSDVMDTARASWILSALEDCVVLGVDVVNMSLGTACGFGRESEEELLNGVYDKIREAGISVVVAASNSYSSAYGSEANGNLGLTSNPDTGTVGSPGTYDGLLSVASINGVETPYLMHDKTIIYFDEANNAAAEPLDFCQSLLGDKESVEMEYVIIPGVGRSADYTGMDVTGKIVLVRRGDNTFEEKALIAEAQGAAGIIVYNNVSGEIKMNVGDAKLAVCSISQDDGQMLVAAGNGKLKISKSQTSGPFISDFSSWGPTPSLNIKPEITGHGGNILSSVTGGGYDRLSGTSMACPNLAGVVILLRQYVVENFPDIANDNVAVNAMVYKLLMSTADIALGTNGNPYAVRKQGAGLANLMNSIKTPAYITTYAPDGSEMDKTKLELGDDKAKNGVYEMSFTVENFGSKSVTYNIGAYVMTEGVSETLTNAGKTTVTEEAYILEGATIEINSVEGGKLKDKQLKIDGNSKADVKLTLTLSDADKAYLDASFENGMYVEGYITLTAEKGTDVSLNVPYLAYYGDWTQAPLFDLTYFDTNADELDEGISEEDKTKADAYATRAIGGLSGDYVSYLGCYYFLQNPADMDIPANPAHISLSNQEGTVHSLRYVWAGLLRNAQRIEIKVTDDVTGEVIFETVDEDVRKSYGDGGSISPANIEIEFDTTEYNLSNNSTYTVTLTGYMDYDEGGLESNKNNTFTFPLTIDFEAPTLSGVEFYTEYDKAQEKNRLYAKAAIYDNHYAMSAQLAYVCMDVDSDGNEMPTLKAFNQYMTPVFSQEDSTTYVTFELTDHLYDIKEGSINPNAFVLTLYDYALNYASYEIGMPDQFDDFYLEELIEETVPETEAVEEVAEEVTEETVEEVAEEATEETVEEVAEEVTEETVAEEVETVEETVSEEAALQSVEDTAEETAEETVPEETVAEEVAETASEEETVPEETEAPVEVKSEKGITLSPNEVYTLSPLVYPEFSWSELLEFTSSRPSVARIVNNKIVAAASGKAVVKVRNPETNASITFPVTVLSADDEGYRRYDKPVADMFRLDGYKTQKAYYRLSSEDKDIGDTGDVRFFNGNYSLSMFPSEIVRLNYTLDAYFPNDTTVEFETSNDNIVSIDAYGNVTAVAEGYASVTIKVMQDGRSTYYSETVSVEVKDPYITAGATLSNYYGNGGLVVIPEDLSLNTIGSFAFSNYDYVEKTAEELAFDDAETSKQWYIGENTITKVIIPEGVKTISSYAFANLTALEEIVLPSTLQSIEYGAFFNCTSLEKITFSSENNLQIINQNAFENCDLQGTLDLSAVCMISNYAFAGNRDLEAVITSDALLSIGQYAFAGCKSLTDVTIESAKVKYGAYAFTGCESLASFYVNAAVLPEGMFYECSSMTEVTVGPDVNEIGEFAFRDTKIDSFVVESGNKAFKAQTAAYILSADGSAVAAVSPTFRDAFTAEQLGGAKITAIANGAFSHNTRITSVELPEVTTIGNYAFGSSENLAVVTLGDLQQVGEYAFFETAITELPAFTAETEIGKYAFAFTDITSVVIPDGMTVEEGVFSECLSLESVTIGNDVTLGKYAFNVSVDNVFSVESYTEELHVAGAVAVPDENNKEKAEDVSEEGEHETAIVEAENAYDMAVQEEKYFYYEFATALKELTIGDNAVIGENAFSNAASLETITLGANAQIGYMAFYNNASLKEIDLSQATSIDDYAFSGDVYYVCVDDSMAYAAISTEGQYIYTYHAADLEYVDLSAATEIGEYAFTYCRELKEVVLNENITTIPTYAFAGCEKLESIDLSHVTEIGEYAFMEAYALTAADLSSVENVGKYAFVNNKTLADLKLGEAAVSVDEGAFAYCESLTAVENSAVLENIGSYAFAYSALESIDLTGAVKIDDAAFLKEEMTPFQVTLGEDLQTLGDNPFAMCVLEPFALTDTTNFNGIESTQYNYNYEISDTVSVIDGSLYCKVNNGLELITYTGVNPADVEVAADTVRITAYAFAGSDVQMVQMPYTVAAIGHKAFFACDDLHTVIFGSYDAPILEEEFDPSYYESFEHIPGTGNFGEYTDYDGTEVSIDGIGLLPYYMWNATDGMYFSVYYGANFVDHVGYVSDKLTMVRPVNGKNYDSFIYSQYFDVTIDGAQAPDKNAMAAIRAIKALPERVGVEDKALVEAARAAYAKIATYEQMAQVTNYADLITAEQRIIALTSTEESAETVVDSTEETLAETTAPVEETKDDSNGPKAGSVLAAILTILVLVGLGGGYYLKKTQGDNALPYFKSKCAELWAAIKKIGAAMIPWFKKVFAAVIPWCKKTAAAAAKFAKDLWAKIQEKLNQTKAALAEKKAAKAEAAQQKAEAQETPAAEAEETSAEEASAEEIPVVEVPAEEAEETATEE